MVRGMKRIALIAMVLCAGCDESGSGGPPDSRRASVCYRDRGCTDQTDAGASSVDATGASDTGES